MTTNYTLQDVQNVFAKTGSTLNSKYASQDPNILYLQAQSSIMNAGNYERVKDSRGEGILDTTTGQFVAGINIGDGAGVTDDAAAQRISAQKRAEQGITLGQTIATDPTATNPTGLTTPTQAPSNPQTEQTEAQRQAAIQAAGQQPAPQGTATGTALATPTAPVSTYTGPSIVDFLASIGQPSDFNSRAFLAQKLGIQNYSGTASQNTQLLNTLRQGAPTPAAGTPAAGTGAGTPAAGAGEGTGGTPATGGATPPASTKSFLDIYKDALAASGLTDIKSEFDKVQKEYDDMSNELADKISDVNANPWLSEGLRLAETKKLQDKYDTKLTILTNKQKIYDSLYQRAQSEARFVASGIQEDQQKSAQLAQDQAEAAAKLLEVDPANIKSVQGGLYDVKENKWIIPPDPESDGKKNTLTISEIKAVGLPISLAGRSETEILRDLGLPLPPAWFKEYYQGFRNETVSPQEMEAAWNNLQNKVQNKVEGSGGLGFEDL